MRPEARVAAAIEILDDILAGMPAEQCLTNWARGRRFAGSGDRAAIRDLVFDALRQKRSFAWLGGAETGRGLMIGALRSQGTAPETVFTGEGYAPASLASDEVKAGSPIEKAPEAIQLDCPDWLMPVLGADHGEDASRILNVLQARAPVFLRANLSRGPREAARTALLEDGIEAEPHGLADTALEVVSNARRIRGSRAYTDGLVELQDAASQAVVSMCLEHIEQGSSILDYCAGGGGKALAFAGARLTKVTAHDVAADRMRDIPARAERAGTPIRIVTEVDGLYDLVLCDAPCTGSGAWRRQPEAKWALDPDRLTALNETQDRILGAAKHHVAKEGVLAYVTCSLLRSENTDRVDAFLAQNPEWTCVAHRQWTPLDGGDGFFLAVLRRH